LGDGTWGGGRGVLRAGKPGKVFVKKKGVGGGGGGGGAGYINEKSRS